MDKVRHNPENNKLSQYSSEVIEHYKKKYGTIDNPDQLSKRERKWLYKIKLFLEKKKSEKEKRKNKKPKCLSKTLKLERITMAQSSCRLQIVIDLSYFHENLMKYNDMRMCIKQIKRCYSENRIMPNPTQLHITSVTGEAEQILSYNNGYKNWDINIHEKSFLEEFNKDEIVYLTSESENVIDTLNDSKVYIIGGLLDHNSLKGISLKKATDNNIFHARLPIAEYVNMNRLKVLPINQVFSLLALVAGGLSWSEALLKILPQRKAPQPKAGSSTINSNENLNTNSETNKNELRCNTCVDQMSEILS